MKILWLIELQRVSFPVVYLKSFTDGMVCRTYLPEDGLGFQSEDLAIDYIHKNHIDGHAEEHLWE